MVFLGFLNYYRDYFKDFVLLSVCLYDLVYIKGSFLWEDIYEEVFCWVKIVLVIVLCLLYLCFDGLFVLDIDVLDYVVGVVFL